jgi:hypothetical protein
LVPVGYGVPLGLSYLDEQDETSAPQTAPQQANNPDQPMDDYAREAPPEGDAQPLFRPLYHGQGQDVRPLYPGQGQTLIAPLAAQPATTLIFKDGRKPLQVHNYALTTSTLYALDGESRQEIPLSLLNVPATVEANRAAGVDFALPAHM